MLIKIVRVSGQTCNKFWTYANFIAEAIERGHQIWILGPDITIRYYPNLIQNDIVKFPLYKKAWGSSKSYSKILSILNKIVDNKISLVLLQKIFIVIPNFTFISLHTNAFKSNYKEKYFNKIRVMFTPSEEIVQNCLLFMENMKRKTDVVIGLHIRYGDYRSYHNGKYYYTLEEYKIVMLKLEKIFSDKNVSFFISSNESIDLKVFSGQKVKMISDTDPTIDLYTLSNCDYIIGPPSTFSGWASYLGTKPIFFIEDVNCPISLEDFRSITELWNE